MNLDQIGQIINRDQVGQIINRLRSRTGLIIIAGVLAALNIGRLGVEKYHAILNGIDSKQALLGQYQMTTRNLDTLRKEIKQLEVRRRNFDAHLFTGESRNEITSAMQIKLQGILGAAGLNPESLRPTNMRRKGDEHKAYGEVVINISLTGKLDNLLKFFSELYKFNYFFKIENFSLRPFKNDELRVFLGLKGFYRLTSPPQEGGTAKGKAAR